MIKKWLYGWILPRILKRRCDSRIPRSGKKGEAVNCYVISIDRDDGPYFVAHSVKAKEVKGEEWDGQSYSKGISLPLENFAREEVIITHYYGLSEVTYESVYDFLWNYVTRLLYIRIRAYRYIDSTHQYFFNKRKLVTKRRMDLLQFMMEDQFDRTHNGIDSLDLMSEIYSTRLFLHPSWEKQHSRLEFYLDSLVSSGELEKISNEYVVTGKAIATLENYEEDERRHTEAVKLQRKLVWLTLMIVVLAFVQSGIVKLPTIVDFSGTDGANADSSLKRETTQQRVK